MSFYHPDRSIPRRFGLVQASFLQIEGLPFAEVPSEDEIQQAFADEGVDFAQEEDEIYTPPLTLWAFLSQVLHQGTQRSCVAAVSRVLVLPVALGREPCSKNTGAYCRARSKLPEKVIERLAVDVVRGCEAQIPPGWLWHKRHVKIVGTRNRDTAFLRPLCGLRGSQSDPRGAGRDAGGQRSHVGTTSDRGGTGTSRQRERRRESGLADR